MPELSCEPAKPSCDIIIYNFRETVGKFEDSHTAMILIKANKVKEMYTREILKGNVSYLKLNKVSRDVSKRHVIPPQRGPCGRCGHVDSVEGQTLEIRNILVWRLIIVCILIYIK